MSTETQYSPFTNSSYFQLWLKVFLLFRGWQEFECVIIKEHIFFYWRAWYICHKLDYVVLEDKTRRRSTWVAMRAQPRGPEHSVIVRLVLGQLPGLYERSWHHDLPQWLLELSFLPAYLIPTPSVKTWWLGVAWLPSGCHMCSSNCWRVCGWGPQRAWEEAEFTWRSPGHAAAAPLASLSLRASSIASWWSR